MNIRELLKSQQALLAELENQVTAYESTDLFVENEQLKTRLEKLESDNNDLTTKSNLLQEHNIRLQEALYTLAEDNRSLFIHQSKNRLNIYFGQSMSQQANKLTALEADIKNRIDLLILHLQRNNVQLSHPLYAKIQSFKEESWKAIQEAHAQLANTEKSLSDNDNKAYDDLQKEPISQKQIQALAKKYSMERFVGLNLISTIGIILIIVASIFTAQFTYVRLTDTQRAIGIFILGGAMLVAGDFFNRRKPNVLSLAITAGGVAILYVALAFSYFVLDIMNVIPALVICVAITATTFVLSTRYRSQTLLVFAFIGGHMPYFAITTDGGMIYGLMVYFFILNMLVLLVSFKMKWTIPTCIGLAFNIIAVGDILRLAYMANVSPVMLTGFVFMAFANYTAIPLIGTYVTRQRFTIADTIIIGINTFASCVSMYTVFYINGWYDHYGLLAFVFSIVYFTLAYVLWMKFEDASVMRDLSALTGLVFFVLIIPFQFDTIWLSLGWLLQGVAMCIYGIACNRRRIMYAGMIIFGLCVMAFLLVDTLEYTAGSDYFNFGLRYLSVTAGSVLILGAFIFKRPVLPPVLRVFKYGTLVNLLGYFYYLIFQTMGRIDGLGQFSLTYMTGAVVVVVTIAYAYGITRIGVLYDSGTKFLVKFFYIGAVIGLFLLNLTISPNLVQIGIGSGNLFATFVVSVILLVVGGLAILGLYIVLTHLAERSMFPSYSQIILAVYSLVAVTQNLIDHYNVSFTSTWISVFFIIVALLWVMYGFAKRHALMRRWGLGLALGTVIKLVFIDLTGITTIQRIISLFVIGAVMVGIAFVYQIFVKRLEVKLDIEDRNDIDMQMND